MQGGGLNAAVRRGQRDFVSIATAAAATVSSAQRDSFDIGGIALLKGWPLFRRLLQSGRVQGWLILCRRENFTSDVKRGKTIKQSYTEPEIKVCKT